MNSIAMKRVLYSLPGVEAVTVRREEIGGLAVSLYYPPEFEGILPAVVIVAGYPDAGFRKVVGCSFQEMGSVVSWAELIAASGMVAVTYAYRDPAADLRLLLAHLRRNAAELRIDENRIALWASSGNAPLALSAMMETRVACAALSYPYTLDLDGTFVADTGKQFGFMAPAVDIDELPNDVPLLLVRAGKDEMPHLNETLDRFIAAALTRNLPVTVVNHPNAPHAFDLFLDSEETRKVIRQTLEFLGRI